MNYTVSGQIITNWMAFCVEVWDKSLKKINAYGCIMVDAMVNENTGVLLWFWKVRFRISNVKNAHLIVIFE